MRKYLWYCAGILIIVSACAHKAAPLFKDRMKPKIVRVRALNNRQVQLSFSEDIDTLSFDEQSIAMYSDPETLSIVAVYPSLSAAEIVCLTAEQTPVKYHIAGVVYDTAQNKGIIASSFEGSRVPDTVAPYIAKYSQGARTYEFDLQFSEAMDTSLVTYYVLPDHATICEWQNLRSCRIIPQDPNDPFKPEATYYLFIDRGVCDASGNSLRPFITSITPDTAYKPMLLKSEVRVHDTLALTGIAVLKRPDARGIAFIKNGQVSFDVRDQDAYTIEVLSNGYSGSAAVWFDSVNTVRLLPAEKTIDSIIH
ncbi:hypothetical protein JXB22_10745 [candidate division WOR-3 bacterium]|nr:hypothetical protein [candidate division WOR-3 bacterium]